MSDHPDSPAPVATNRRRANRLTVPRCPHCHSDETSIVLREQYVMYARCAPCGHVWPVARPGQRLPGEIVRIA
jgi:Zn ribbon nucleic-acid-binding protein